MKGERGWCCEKQKQKAQSLLSGAFELRYMMNMKNPSKKFIAAHFALRRSYFVSYSKFFTWEWMKKKFDELKSKQNEKEINF